MNNFYPSYGNSYVYESKFLGESLVLDEAYFASAKSASVACAVIAFALLLFAAIAIKKARPLGIMAAITQPVGLFASFKAIAAFASIDFSCLELSATGSSMAQAEARLNEMLAEAFAEKIAPTLLAVCFWDAVIVAVNVLALVYFIMLTRAERAKGFAVTALVFWLLKMTLFASPVELVSFLLNFPSQEIQSCWDFFFRAVTILPFVLVAAQGVFSLIKLKDPQQAAKAEAEVTAFAAEVAKDSAAQQGLQEPAAQAAEQPVVQEAQPVAQEAQPTEASTPEEQ